MKFGKKKAKEVEHAPSYHSYMNGSSQIKCSCGWESPCIDMQKRFTLGQSSVRTPDSFFEEHLALADRDVETQMKDPAAEKAVTPAQSASPRR